MKKKKKGPPNKSQRNHLVPWDLVISKIGSGLYWNYTTSHINSKISSSRKYALIYKIDAPHWEHRPARSKYDDTKISKKIHWIIYHKNHATEKGSKNLRTRSISQWNSIKYNISLIISKLGGHALVYKVYQLLYRQSPLDNDNPMYINNDPPI